MEDHAGMMTGMMWGMGLLRLLLAVVLALAAAALVQYLFFGRRRCLVMAGAAVLSVASVAIFGFALGFRRIADPSGLSEEPAVIARGERIYAVRCASCHGTRLEGQADWQSPRADGKMPAPPHNSDGHTWHHDSATLFGITKHGLVPPWAPPDYESDMPPFAGVLSDEEIWAVLSFIASSWNEEAKSWQRQIEAQARR